MIALIIMVHIVGSDGYCQLCMTPSMSSLLKVPQNVTEKSGNFAVSESGNWSP